MVYGPCLFAVYKAFLGGHKRVADQGSVLWAHGMDCKELVGSSQM